jgi:hypothetical protein
MSPPTVTLSTEFFRQGRPHRGMDPGEYLRYFAAEAAKASAGTQARQDERARYLPLNLQRSNRIGATYAPSNDIGAAARGGQNPQLWMVLTEPWCGDSAQNLPYIARIAACGPALEFRILLRDQNQDIMDAYLTNGTRSIPKLVSFSLEGRELFRWGPRPQPAADLFRRLSDAGVPVEEIRRKLHLWYARNRGRTLEEEFLALLSNQDI